ncbi:type II secretion system F family protein, partial [Peptoniphilus rhinitidis]
ILIAFIYHKKNPEFFHKIFLKFKNYRMKETLKFTFNMDLLLGAGLTVDKSLKIISNMERNVILKKKYEKILKDIKSGESFSKSIEKTKVFPQILISMVHVGEESSNLKEIFSTMSKFYDEELSSHNKKFLGVLGPVLIIIMSIIIGFIVLSIALPIFDMVNQF